MKFNFEEKSIIKTIIIEGYGKVVLIDPFKVNNDKFYKSRNIIFIDEFGNTIWQVISDFDNDVVSFTNIIYDGNILCGYRWGGGMYGINLTTGKATPQQFMK